MNIIRTIIKNAIEEIKEFHLKEINLENIQISPIKTKVEGHYCSNILFSIRNFLKLGFEVSLEKAILNSKLVKQVNFISGYINLIMSSEFFAKKIQEMLAQSVLNLGNNQKVNIEYCSVNPTGCLHIGHARNAILGDSIARLLKNTGFDVTKEYYVNDGGNQINLLAESVYAIYCKNNNIKCVEPENGYKNEEIAQLAKKINEEDSLEEISQKAVKFFVSEIKKDLKKLKIEHDIWIYESEIIKAGFIEKALEILKENGVIYQGERETKQVKKGKEGNNSLLLLETTKFGDDQDRPLTKQDGSWTYFAPDIGYHLNKIERNFSKLICILGADHDSYAQRIKIATKLLKEGIEHEVIVCQMVSFEHNGNLVKFSKRAGNSIKVSEFLEKIEPDILRFIILERSPQSAFIFDYEKATTISMKNPLFYCQYAYARGCSILRKFEPKGEFAIEKAACFSIKEFQELLVNLSFFEQVLAESVKEFAPHLIVNYTKQLAEKLHQLWQAGKMDSTKLFILEDEKETYARIQIVKTFLQIMKNCFEILGIEAKEVL